MASRAVRFPKILLFGDSLTQLSFSPEGCWGTLLADHFQRRVDFVVRGFSGYTSRYCRELLPYVATDLKDVVGVTVLLGANDASTKAAKNAVPLDEYVTNMKSIVKHFQSAGVKPIVISPPALNAPGWKEYCEETGKVFAKDEDLTATYAQACVSMAADMNVPCIDLHTAMINQADWRKLLGDGLHFSTKGSNFLASLLIPALEKHLGADLPKDVLLPLWGDVDDNNVADSLEKWVKKES